MPTWPSSTLLSGHMPYCPQPLPTPGPCIVPDPRIIPDPRILRRAATMKASVNDQANDFAFLSTLGWSH
eukprot:6250143-Prymnesium_polylepis.1